MSRLRPALVALAAALALAGACSVAGRGGRREAPTPAPDPTSRRSLASGEVVGFEAPFDTHAWLGIPFARPPQGELRWRAPRPPEPWAGTRQALRFGPVCTQPASPLGGVDGAKRGTPVGGEDCLYLNVWAPRWRPEEVPDAAQRLPVMVWIHGGGNVIGDASFYDGSRLAGAHDLVVVSIHYRLGPFGWFRHRALASGDAHELDRSGNYGTLDQIRALEWVRDNVAAFGGDPGNVTIFGESAGGTNVFMLLVSPLAKGLFHRAIAQSGNPSALPAFEAESFADDHPPGHRRSSNEILLKLLAGDGGVHDRSTARRALRAMGDAELATYLRGKGAHELLSAYLDGADEGILDVPRVFRDGLVLPDEDPAARFARAGGYHQVPVMLGTNRDENKLFMFLDKRHVRRLFWIFPRLLDPVGYQIRAEYLSKTWKASGADEPAAKMRRVQGPSVFVYRFDWDEEPSVLGSDLSLMLGAAHGFEIPFVFGHWNLGRQAKVIFSAENAPGREALAASMMSYWAQFAYRGDPGRGRDGEEALWSAWDDSAPDSPRFVILDTPQDGGIRMSSASVSKKSVIAEVERDPRLATSRAKCAVLAELAQRWPRYVTEADYAAARGAGCSQYPLASLAADR